MVEEGEGGGVQAKAAPGASLAPVPERRDRVARRHSPWAAREIGLGTPPTAIRGPRTKDRRPCRRATAAHSRRRVRRGRCRRGRAMRALSGAAGLATSAGEAAAHAQSRRAPPGQNMTNSNGRCLQPNDGEGPHNPS
jgi:hypothetical protein